MLPSEAQWEYGARGGASTLFFTGTKPETLEGAANLSDRFSDEHGSGGTPTPFPWLDDGATVHAPIGSYISNAYGLHDVVGNVEEWCLDGVQEGFFFEQPNKDPVVPWIPSVDRRRSRGASHRYGAAIGDWSHFRPPEERRDHLGVRPARALDP